jgi:hypothetical protein
VAGRTFTFKERSRREEVVEILAKGILDLLLKERQQEMSNSAGKRLDGVCDPPHEASESWDD